MKKKRIIRYISIFMLIAVFIVSCFLFTNKGYTTSVSFSDWGSIKEINNNYSYSTLFMSESTHIIDLSEGVGQSYREFEGDEWKYWNNGEEAGWTNIPVGATKKVLITNCATNANGDLLDVVITIDNIVAFANYKPSDHGNRQPHAKFQIGSSYTIPINPLEPKNGDGYVYYYDQQYNNPIVFDFESLYASADFTMTYYKAGHYMIERESAPKGDISAVSGIYWDLDIVNNGKSDANLYTNELFGGNEGFAPQVGASTIYYDTNSHPNDTYKHVLQQYPDQGIAIGDKPGENIDSIYYESSVFMTTRDITDSTFKFRYSGRECGINYMFASPYPYTIEKPVKTVSKSILLPGESTEYTIFQYVPNNYYGDLFQFHNIYNSLYESTRFNSFSIVDKINENYIITGPVNVRDENGRDVSGYFSQPFYSGNEIRVSATPAALIDSSFYAHTYFIKVPVKLKETTANIGEIDNSASLIYSRCETLNNCPSYTLESPPVQVFIKYRLTVNYYQKGTNNPVAAPDGPTEYMYGQGYNTNPNKGESDVWEYANESSGDAQNGTITKDTVVNYYFQKRQYKLTVNYYEEGSNAKIDDPRETILRHGDGYSTDYNNINLSKWQFVRSDGDSTTGTITRDTVVNYYFKKIPYTLTVNYYVKNTHTPIDTTDGVNPKVTNPVYYDDSYSTNYNNVNLKKWRLTGSDGDATSGTIRGNTTVNYYFEKIPYTLTVNFLEEGTNKPIDTLDGVNPKITNPVYYDDPYSTNYNNVNLKKWRIVRSEVAKGEGSIVDNQTKVTEGIIRGDTTINYYFEKIPYKLTVNYYEEETGDVIATPDVTNPIYYDDPYETDYDKIEHRMWRIVRSEVNITEDTKVSDIKEIDGIIRGDTVVNYYFEKIPYPVRVNYYDADTGEKIDESDETIYYFDMLYYTNYDKINMDVWEYVSTDGDEVKGRITGDQESYTINYYFNRLKYQLTVNYYDDVTKEKIDKSERAAYNYGDEYDTNYDKIDENYWEYVRTEGETPGVIDEDKEVDYYFNNREYRLEVNYYDEETGEKIEETEVSSHKFGEEYTTNDDKIDKKKWELVEEPANKEGTVDGDIEVNYYYRKKKYKITVNYYEEGTENKIAESRESEAYYGDKYITDYNNVDGKVWELVGMPDNYQGEVDRDIVVNYYFRQVVIENPQTGSNMSLNIVIPIVSIITILSISIIVYRIYLKRKIYKI